MHMINNDDEPVELITVQGTIEAEVIKSLLESASIMVTLISPISQNIYPFSVDGLGVIKILVPLKHRNQALEILEKYQTSQPGDDQPV